MARETGAGSPSDTTSRDGGAGAPSALGVYAYTGDTGAGSPYPSSLIPRSGSIHPFPSFQIIAAVATSRTTVAVYFSEPLDETSAETTSRWTIALDSALGASVIVTGAVLDDGDGDVVTLTVHRFLTPGATYEVTATQIESAAGLIDTVSRTFTVPVIYAVGTLVDDGLGPLRALLKTFSRQLRRIAGVPHTYLAAPWFPGDERALLETTYEFPNRASVFTGTLQMTYDGATSGSIESIVPEFETVVAIPQGTKVTLIERAMVLPGIVGIPAVAGTASTVQHQYYSPGNSGDSAEADSAAVYLTLGSTLMFWMYVTATDEGGRIIDIWNNDGQIALQVVVSAGSGYVLDTLVSTPMGQGVTGTLGPYSLAHYDHYAFVIGLDGVVTVSRNAVVIGDTPLDPPAGAVVADPVFLLISGLLNRIAITNVALFQRTILQEELVAIVAGGVSHDLSEPYTTESLEAWVGEVPALYWRRKAAAGVVPNEGSAGAIGLVLNGGAIAEFLMLEEIGP